MGVESAGPAPAVTGGQEPGLRGERLHNSDVDWDRWPVQTYLTENYREPHPADLAVIRHHAEFYRQFEPGSVGRSIEFGAGPNLYPLMLAASVSRRIEAVEPSAANVAYLDGQLRRGADPTWLPFYDACRALLRALPQRLDDALSIVRVRHQSGLDLEQSAYDLGSMHFVAESVTEDVDEFAAFCGRFAGSVRPGGALVAAFMENMGRYHLGDGSTWPGLPVDSRRVATVFAPLTTELEITRIDADSTLPDYGYSGMVLLTARRTAQPGS